MAGRPRQCMSRDVRHGETDMKNRYDKQQLFRFQTQPTDMVPYGASDVSVDITGEMSSAV